MSEEKPKAPDWLLLRDGLTQRLWRQRKRMELQELIRSFKTYQIGCYYCPGYASEVAKLLGEILLSMQKSHSQKEWGK